MAVLASVLDPALLPTAIAEAIEMPPQGTREPRISLLEHLRDRNALLLLDNCEHLVESVALLVRDLLRAAPALRVLATSREPLHLDLERVVQLVPLVVTEPDGRAGPAVQLFMERAANSGRPLGDDPTTRRAVAVLCARLDGLPLAIELAAARLRSMSLADLDARLDHRFRVLTGGVRGASPRQRTLEATGPV